MPGKYFLLIAGSVSVLFGQTAMEGILSQYCIGCHNERLKTANVSLSDLKVGTVGANRITWEKVLRKMRTGEMPPVGLARPEPGANQAAVSWLEAELDGAAKTKPNPGTPSIHRLNRAEYSNAVRDLLALDLDHGASLPADDSGYGFDNIGEVLTISPLLMEKYMSTARRVTRLAVGTAKVSPAIERFNAGRGAEPAEELPLSLKDGTQFRRYFPVDAEYSILVRLRGNPAPNTPQGKLDVRVDGKRVKLFDVNINTAEEAQYTRNYEFRLKLEAGMHLIGAGTLAETTKLEGGVLAPRGPFTPPPPTAPSVEYVQIGGPFDVAGPGETESRKRIFACRPAAGEPEAACARKILANLARRAYRRPVNDIDLQPLLKLFEAGRADGKNFETGIEMGLRGILVSPNFLFRVERAPAGSTEGKTYRVSDLELASRLSFFLWSSLPDEELLRTAEQGKLKGAVLEGQVRRMLADRKSKALIENFAGQWLHLRNVSGWRPDPDKYANFDESLRTALERETQLFFAYIVREDRSVLDFLNADYTFLNERLARHYGLAGVRGNYYRRVALTSPERGGILTHGSVLTVTSYPTRTSPVLRGKWILENVLGSPPPPPPPDVPDLADGAATSPKNLRQLLEKHREKAACASCHARLDPLGFALENYDATGRFRSSEGGAAIDASGSLPGGIAVNGPGDLKKVLLDRREEFVECLAEKMLTYALGRGLQYYDLPTVRSVRREVTRQEYKFSALALAIVKSVPFEMRRIPEK